MKKNNFIEIETERLILRRFKNEDLENFYNYRSNPDVAIFQGWHDYTYKQAIDFIKKQKVAEINIPGTWVQVAIESKEKGCLIGDFGVHTLLNPPNQIEIGFTLDPEFQNKGYATEALKKLLDYFFNKLNKEKVRAIAVEQNNSSIKLLEKIGFKKVNIIENSYFKGTFVNEFEFELSKNDWIRVGDEKNK